MKTISIIVFLTALLILIITSVKLYYSNRYFSVKTILKASYDKNKSKLSITYKDGRTSVYYGSSTVWHFESGRKCDTWKDSFLYEVWSLTQRSGSGEFKRG